MLALSASIARWLFLCGGIFLGGTLALLWLSRDHRHVALVGWREQCLRVTRILAGVALLAGAGAAVLQAVQTTGGWNKLQGFFLATRSGGVWVLRLALLVVVLFVLLAWRPLATRVGLSKCAAISCVFATASMAAGGLGGHAVAFEPAWPTMIAQVVHLAAVSLWLGALPALATLLRASDQDETGHIVAGNIFQKFSNWAMWLMMVIVASGVPLADLQVERFPALIGTSYGVTLMWKLLLIALVLGTAAHLRFLLLPRFAASTVTASSRQLARWIALECALAMLAVWAAVQLSETIPARHDRILWPFDFRYSVDATWADATVRERVYLGWVVLAFAVLIPWAALQWRIALKHWLPVTALLLAAGLVVMLPPLKTDAYPDTYRKTAVPYQAISIASGAALYNQHCAGCHGVAGHGNGPLAALLPRRPVDLTEPHTALHTAGDLFWWLTHGKAPGVMPGFSHSLSDDERWDAINFLRALSNGYQARILNETIVPNKPWLAAPDFNFTTATGGGTLKDFRGKSAVLLVLGAGEALSARMAELAQAQARLAAGGATVLVVPSDTPTALPVPGVPVVLEGNAEIAETYALLRRTLGNADLRDTNKIAFSHIEFLIDKYGYVRARWVAAENQRGWHDIENLSEQLALLARERRLLPPPDDHVH